MNTTIGKGRIFINGQYVDEITGATFHYIDESSAMKLADFEKAAAAIDALSRTYQQAMIAIQTAIRPFAELARALNDPALLVAIKRERGRERYRRRYQRIGRRRRR